MSVKSPIFFFCAVTIEGTTCFHLLGNHPDTTLVAGRDGTDAEQVGQAAPERKHSESGVRIEENQ